MSPSPTPAAPPLVPIETEVAPVRAAQYHAECPSRPDAISAEMGRAFERLVGYADRHGLRLSGPPRAVYTGYDSETVRFTVAIPVADDGDVPAEEGLAVAELPGGPVYRFVHRGPYDGLSATYRAITAWMVERGLMQSEADWARYSPMWEEYVNDPGTAAPADLVTHIYVPRGP